MKSMGVGPFKDQTYSLTKKLLPWTIYAIFPLAIFRLYFYPLQLPQSSTDQLPNTSSITVTITSSSSSPTHISSSKEQERADDTPCDYTIGKWVHDKSGPLYNGTTCGAIKDGQNCINHGRPDLDYLHWRWKPKQCDLQRFEPNTFLQLIRNKHIAFVGDSMARNQLESLLCMLATASLPNLVYKDSEENKFRRWHFPSHNANLSVYWSPFLVKGIEKSQQGPNYNKLYLDHVDERWASELDHIDMIVFSVGHWFLHPAVYFEGDSVLGCHYCPGLNHTEIGFYDVLRKSLRTTLKTITERRGSKSNGNGIDVIVTTFSPSHFEGDWDKAGACPKKKPYSEGEKQLEGMDAEMRKSQVEEVEAAKENAKQFAGCRVEALDVTKLSLMRPDGHPGPYMHPFPFANGVAERVQNDCVHWCLPGPIDTWNEILLQVLKKWEGPSRRGE
ncbi:xyloglucan O-acetyltransferase 1 [Alnus glutinosa]|uniref:xyloglucan O-acetyltransferase 1 n=1 Tax=Alnus glutinosa TaxID=3517 RepID=UPI002D7971B4|nr:xyloglucan O-acetyltransferase 1 [Alnus glutinosa]